MSFRKEPDYDPGWLANFICKSPEHNPPSMVDLGPGIWSWTCQTCGHKQFIRVEPQPSEREG